MAPRSASLSSSLPLIVRRSLADLSGSTAVLKVRGRSRVRTRHIDPHQSAATPKSHRSPACRPKGRARSRVRAVRERDGANAECNACRPSNCLQMCRQTVSGRRPRSNFTAKLDALYDPARPRSPQYQSAISSGLRPHAAHSLPKMRALHGLCAKIKSAAPAHQQTQADRAGANNTLFGWSAYFHPPDPTEGGRAPTTAAPARQTTLLYMTERAERLVLRACRSTTTSATGSLDDNWLGSTPLSSCGG